MNLDTTGRSLEIILSAIITTRQLHWRASYYDINQSTFAISAAPTNHGLTNSTTLVTMVAAPGATTTRAIKSFTVFNDDTVAATVTIRIADTVGPVTRTEVKITLAVGDTLFYAEGIWKVIDLNGNTKGAGGVASVVGTAAEVTASPTVGAVVLSLPAALTFTGKTITGGTFASPTLQTPALGTPVSGVMTNVTGLPTAGLLDDAVTYAKIQNVSATDRILGRVTAGAGDIEEIATTGSGNVVRTTSPTLGNIIVATPWTITETSERLRLSGGSLLLGTTVTAGAEAGSLVLANDKPIQAVIASGASVVGLWKLLPTNSAVIGTGNSASIAVDGTLTITDVQNGLFIISEGASDKSALFMISGLATTELSDPAGIFSATVDTASSVNVYVTAGNLTVQNKRAAGFIIRAILLKLGSF